MSCIADQIASIQKGYDFYARRQEVVVKLFDFFVDVTAYYFRMLCLISFGLALVATAFIIYHLSFVALIPLVVIWNNVPWP